MPQITGGMGEAILYSLLLNSTNLNVKTKCSLCKKNCLTKEDPINQPTMRHVTNLLKNIFVRMETKN